MPIKPGAEPYQHDGGKVGALLSHGFTGSPASMRPWGQYLADAGLTVRAPRLPGHGTKWQDMNLTRYDDWYGEITRAFDELLDKCDVVFAMGMSMGGSLMLRLAEERGDEVAGLVVVNPAVHTERMDRHLLPFLQVVVPAFPGISNDIKKPGQDEVAYDRIPLKAAYSMSKGWHGVKSNIAKVDQPFLLFRSLDDHVVEPSNAAWLLANVSSTDKEEITLPNSYHVATLDNDADVIFSNSLDFVKRLAGNRLTA